MDAALRTGPVSEFCAQLDELRIESGADVPLLAKRLGLSRAQLYAILAGRIKRPPDWDRVVRPLVDLCAGGDRSAVAAWRRRHDILIAVWEELRRRDQPELATSRLVPHQLPARVRHFAGRSAELAVLTSVLDQAADSSVTVISGSAGVGKTTLAVHWAHEMAGRFPDGQLYADLRGYDPSGSPASPADAIHGFLGALGVTADRIPARLDQRASLYRSLLDGRRVLVVLDNASDAAQLRSLLPGSPSCAVLVTSRNPLTGLLAAVAARTIALDVLPPLEARDLLAARLGPERLSREPEAVRELVTLCAHLPLALSIAAARATVSPAGRLAALVAELNDSRLRLDALDTGDAMMSVRAVFSWSYQRLSPGARRLFQLLGLHPGPDISTAAASALAGLPVARARPLLTELADVHLLTEQSAGRFGCHDLLRAYAAELAGADAEDHAAALLRVLDYYLGTARAANTLLYPSRGTLPLPPPQDGAEADPLADQEQAGNWLRAERLVLLGAIAKAAELGMDVHAWQIAFYLARFLDFGGYWDDWARAQEFAISAAARLDDTNGLARTHLAATYACLKLGEEQRALAHATSALELFERLGDQSGLARAHLALHKVSEKQNDYASGFEHVQYALVLFWSTSNPIGLAIALDLTGFSHAHLGNLSRALACSSRALHLHREAGNRIGEAGSLDSLGYVHHLLGEYPTAIEFYQQSVRIYREHSEFESACVQVRLGDTYLDTGHHHNARAAWQAALAVLATVHHPSADRIRARLAYLDAPSGPQPVFEPIATA